MSQISPLASGVSRIDVEIVTVGVAIAVLGVLLDRSKTLQVIVDKSACLIQLPSPEMPVAAPVASRAQTLAIAVAEPSSCQLTLILVSVFMCISP